jgi:hypothetical protein
MCFWRFVVTTATFVALSCLMASAQTLAPDELYEKRKSSVVFFRAKSDADIKGYGVLISKQGHVLTAAHVIRSFGEREPIRATIGSKQGQLVEFEQDVQSMPELDVSVLKIKNPQADLHPAPIGKADRFKAATTNVQILAGFVDMDPSTPFSATVSSNVNADPDLWRMQGAGIDRGHSGSPAFDQFGDVVGFVPEGFAGTGVFNLRSFAKISVWLKQIDIPIVERERPIKFAVYVRGIERNERIGLSLQKTLTEVGERWLGVKQSEIETDPPFLGDIMTRWDDSIPRENLLEPAVNELGAQWLTAQDAQTLYLYFAKLNFVRDGGFPASAKHLLVALEHDGKIYKTKQIRLHSVTFEDRADLNDERRLDATALAMARSAADTPGAPFRQNGFIFADCLKGITASFSDQVRRWQADAPQKLTAVLRDKFLKDPKKRRYRLAGSHSSTCGPGRFSIRPEALRLNELQSGMAELVIDSAVSDVGQPDELEIEWKLRRARPYGEAKGDLLRVHLVDFASGLATSIDDKWNRLLEDLQAQN